MFERSHLSIGEVLGHGTVTTAPRYLDKHYPSVLIYDLFFLERKKTKSSIMCDKVFSVPLK